MKTDLEPRQYWGVFTLLVAAMLTGLNVLGAYVNDLSVSVAYQPKTATGLAAGYPFEAGSFRQVYRPICSGLRGPAGAAIHGD
jgi:hypothetical protein